MDIWFESNDSKIVVKIVQYEIWDIILNKPWKSLKSNEFVAAAFIDQIRQKTYFNEAFVCHCYKYDKHYQMHNFAYYLCSD